MTSISLKIETEDELCGDKCMFKLENYLVYNGKCNLFNEILYPHVRLGDVEG